ncbi:MAG: hypothetical protein ACRCTK_01555 [Alphaproteobacteria bacterium]
MDDSFPFHSKSGSKIALRENMLFKLNKRLLDEKEAEKAIKDFESLIGKFKDVILIRLSEKDSFSPKLKEFLANKERNIELISLKQETIPDYIFVTCAKRIQMGFDIFESNQKRGFAIYDPIICKKIALKYNLPEEEVKKKFEDGTVNELFKDTFRNVKDLTQYLIKELDLFLFTAEELKRAEEYLGYYPVSQAMLPYDIYSKDSLFLCHPEIPIEFIELFSSDFNRLPNFTVFTKEYLLEREANIGKILGFDPNKIPDPFLHHIVIAYLFPSSCQMIPLLKVQERAERVARFILGLEEESGGGDHQEEEMGNLRE